jgi:hypothetical protein
MTVRIVNQGSPRALPVLVKALVMARHDKLQAVENLKHFAPSAYATAADIAAADRICRGMVNAGSTSSLPGLIEAGLAPRAFVPGLAGVSLLDAIEEHALPIPAGRPVSIVVVTAGSAVSEGAPKPVSNIGGSIAPGEPLVLAKYPVIIVLTNELLAAMGDAGLRALQAVLPQGVGSATNAAIIADLVAGRTPIASEGSFLGDVGNGLSGMVFGSGARIVVAVSTQIGKYLATATDAVGGVMFPQFSPTGGTIQGMQIIVVDELASDRIVLVDATQVAVAPEGTITFDTARHATLQMRDDPQTGAQQIVSLWQTDSTAIRAERWAAWRRLRAAAVAVIDGVDYSAVSP